MRHKFTAEETVRGFKRAAQVRASKLKLEKKALKERSKEWFWDQVGKLTEAEKLPYLAAFTFGALAAAESHSDLDPVSLTSESFRQGIEAVIFLDLAKTQASSLAGNAAQIFGVAGLTAIGLQVPLASIVGGVTPGNLPANVDVTAPGFKYGPFGHGSYQSLEDMRKGIADWLAGLGGVKLNG